VNDSPAASRAKIKKHTSIVTTGSPETSRPSLRDGLRLIRALPGAPGFLATVAGGITSANLTPASGCQDHTILPSASSVARLASPKRPPHPAPRFVTLRNAPLSGRDGNEYTLIWVFGKTEIFLKKGWTNKITGGALICPSGYFVAGGCACARQIS
jgi:hypothetical protein